MNGYNDKSNNAAWVKIRTPLHLFGLIALIAEAIVLSIPLWSDISPTHQFYLAISAIGLLCVIIIVSMVIYIRSASDAVRDAGE